MIHAAFAVWLFIVLFAGTGIYRLWTGMVSPVYVSWALLPGTLVSEMAYILGCLVTGGEVRRARLIEAPSRKGRSKSDGEPTTESTAGIRFVGPILASLLAVVACAAGILLAHHLLGRSIIQQFWTFPLDPSPARVPRELPYSWSELWSQLHGQIDLLRTMCESLADRAWLTWRGVLFFYLALCLAVRLSPVSRPMRPTLAAVVVIAACAAGAGLAFDRFSDLVHNLWPLLTYVWASLLLLLVVTLILRGIVGLVRILAGGS